MTIAPDDSLPKASCPAALSISRLKGASAGACLLLTLWSIHNRFKAPVSSVMQPHCDADLASVAAEAAPQSIDIVVTPVVNQELIAYPLASTPTETSPW